MIVDVWLIPTDQPASVAKELWNLLDESERARCAGADPVVRRRFTVVHGAVRQLVGARLGVRPADVVWRRGLHGKPLPERSGGLEVNYSASDSLAALALSDGRPLGVDVERIHDRRVAGRVAARFFPAAEARAVLESPERFTELWCRREACAKAYGGRLVQSFGLPVDGPSPLLLADAGALGPGPVWLSDVPVPGPFRAALAVLGESPCHVNCEVWQGS